MLHDRYDPYYFRDHVGDDGPLFDFVLRPGRASTRTAIGLLAARGARAAIIERAVASAHQLDARSRVPSVC